MNVNLILKTQDTLARKIVSILYDHGTIPSQSKWMIDFWVEMLTHNQEANEINPIWIERMSWYVSILEKSPDWCPTQTPLLYPLHHAHGLNIYYC